MAKRTKKSALRKRLRKEIESLWIIDAHSHMKSREAYYAEGGGPDLFQMLSYFRRDLSGLLSAEQVAAFDSAQSPDEKWGLLRLALERGRNVSYWRHHLVTFAGLYGFQDEELNDGNWRSVDEAIRQHAADPDWYDTVLKERCRIQTGLLNVDPFAPDCERRYSTPTVRLEKWLQLHDRNMVEQVAQYVNAPVTDLDSLETALALALQQYRDAGAVGVKLAHAYGRTLLHERPTRAAARRLFAKVLKGDTLSAPERKQLQDQVVFWVAERAGELGLVFQIHCGTQTNWAHIPDSNPLLLCNLLNHARHTRFDLFHAGYPWTAEHGMLGKHYPNVTVSMCWMYLITTTGSRRTLAEWIDLVPGSRIIGFGSDVPFPENVYGHLEMAKRCLLDVLVDKVRNDFLSEEAAIQLARQMLRTNALEWYGLPEAEPPA